MAAKVRATGNSHQNLRSGLPPPQLDFNVTELGNDLLGMLWLPAWHLLPSLGFGFI
jgi:hypothetical protein